MSTPRIIPEETDLTRPYWDAARRGVVALQRCEECDQVWHPPLPACPRNTHHQVVWIDASGEATLHSYTVVHHAVHPAVSDRTPYIVALVDLAEGPRFVCTLLDAEEQTLRVGRQVRISLGRATGGLMLPVARLSGDVDGASPTPPA